MQGVLIADDNMNSCRQMADLIAEAGYAVTVTNSTATVLEGVLKKTAQVLLIGSEFDEVAITDLIPLLKKCNKDLAIIFVSSDASLSLVRKLRNDGIFYHAMNPDEQTDKEELKQAVECALESHRSQYLH